MRKFLITAILIFGLASLANGQLRTFISEQLGSGPVAGEILQTDGSNSTWVTTAGIGVPTSTEPFMASYFVATSTTATSTAANGWNLSGGCFAITGTCLAAGGVTSVSNSNGSLTISPTTGAVVATLNVGNANTWTAVQKLDSSGALRANDGNIIGWGTGAAGAPDYDSNFNASDNDWEIDCNFGTVGVICGDFVFNEVGNNLDFRIESNNDANMFFLNGSTDRVGIATSSPYRTFSVAGNVGVSGHLISASSTSPTVSACGTSPSIVGTDEAGKVTIGTGGIAASCTLTFTTVFTKAPACFANNESQILLTRAVSTVTTVVLDVATVFGASDKVSYFCKGYE